MTAPPAAMTRSATVGAVLEAAATRLAASGVADPRREARLILGLALGLSSETVFGWPEREIGLPEAVAVDTLVERRARGEPLSRLRGKREFWSLEFALSPDTLDPRPDSETLVAAALAGVADRQTAIRIIDFGTGTGCLLLALLSELPNATGIGIDILPGAVETARANANAHGLANRAEFRLGGWRMRIEGPADVIVANPPYIPSGEIDGLGVEVASFEPRVALDGGRDGLAAYRSLGPVICGLLAPDGQAYLEIGAGQRKRASRVLEEAGLRIRAVNRDLAGIGRCLNATL